MAAPTAGADSLPCDTYTDVALGKTATASSSNGAQVAAKAVDGNNASKWLSLVGDPQWLQVDLGSSRAVCEVDLNWGNYATAFSVQISDDAANWTTLVSTGATKNGNQALPVASSGRYLRIYGTGRGDPTLGYGIRELDVYSPALPQSPVFTSPTTAAFTLGTHDKFSITTRAVPAVTSITETGALPAGLKFTDAGDGTASIVGTPTGGSGGSYPITVTAVNGVPPNATQTLTIQVTAQAPTFTSPATASFLLGQAKSFPVSTTGIPAVTTITESGTLPAGLSFTDHGDGTASIAGTPAGSAGSYPVTLTASNGVPPNATQTLTIQVSTQAPTFTSPATASFGAGVASSFAITTSGVPTVTSITESGSLPPGTTFTNHGDGTASITGTPTSAGSYPVTLTASNGVPPDATQTLTIQVSTQAPTFTSPATASFTTGVGNTFSITTSGAPTVTTIAESGALPAGLVFTDRGDGTATIGGTPTGSTGGYPVTLTASNGVPPDATQALTIQVGQPGGGVQLSVTTTADIATNAGDCGNSSTTVHSPLSLREAICIANNYTNTQRVTITLPAGTYNITNGELQMGKVSGSNISLTGAGSASTVIDGNHLSRVLDLDPAIVGGVTSAVSGVTITNGRDGTFGGAGIIAGSGNVAALDTLVVANSVISNNQANYAVPTASNKPGGGIQFIGGSLSLTNVTVSGNQSFSSSGSGVYYQASGSTGGQTLTINGATFSGNSTANSGTSGSSGGALALAGGTYTVSNVTFTGNSASSGSAQQAAGGAIFQRTGNLTVIGSTFTGNSVSGSGALGGPILYTAGTAALHYNRFLGNTGAGGAMTNGGTGTADVTENWWGCTTGPNTTGCESSSGTNITAAPRLVLTATASPSQVAGPGGTATLTASLLTDSAGNPVSASSLAGAFSGLPVSFADPPGDATVGGSPGAHSVNLAGGVASIDYHSNSTLGPDDDLVTLDNAAVPASVEVDAPPAITSADNASFTVGTAGSFTVTTAACYPAVTAVSESGALPAGLSFTDNGDGTATLAGTPSAGSGGSYPITITAGNGSAPDASQAFTLTVSPPIG